MTVFHAIALGIVQGITEFLPISSSGHLLILPWLFHWNESSLSFDVALHTGTLVAMLAYFWSDWRAILAGSMNDLRDDRFGKRLNSKLLLFIVLGSIPAGIAGIKYEHVIEDQFRAMYLGVAVAMMALGVLLYLADILGRKQRSVNSVGVWDAIVIGCSQALALFPGVSRSGATITAGLFAGLNREAAARFSFLLATPIIFGAAALKLAETAKQIAHHQPLDSPISLLLIGLAVSAIVGYAVIAWLLSYIKRHSMLPFVIYRILFGLMVIFIYHSRLGQ